ncbi:helix-turn-helix domain-containing protein [Collinsella sp. HCP28S3_E12]|uniref:helix-turn-helix domain-containing protein n=1 Tax=Collinsella sp. HCP28S3_E12 TaxID=3438921 RepID=UPI003F8C550A
MDKGSNIALLREQLGLTQAEFARDLGVAKETVCRWEKNRTAIRPRHIQKMVKLYGVTEDDILSDSIGLAAREALRSAKGEGLNPQTRDAFPILRIKRSGNGTSLQSVGATLTPSDIAERHLHAAYVQMNNKDMTLLYPQGTLLLVDPDVKPYNGCTVVAAIDAVRVLIRRYSMGNNTIMLSTHSYDSTAPDLILDRRRVRIIGVVVWYRGAMDIV